MKTNRYSYSYSNANKHWQVYLFHTKQVVAVFDIWSKVRQFLLANDPEGRYYNVQLR